MLDYCTRISQPARSTACTGGIRVRYLAGNTSLLLWSSMSQMPAFAQHWHCYCNHAYTFELLSFALPSAPHRVHNCATQASSSIAAVTRPHCISLLLLRLALGCMPFVVAVLLRYFVQSCIRYLRSPSAPGWQLHQKQSPSRPQQ